MPAIRCEWEISSMLGEGPIYYHSENSIYWVDILSNLIHCYHITDKFKKTWKFDQQVTSLVPRKSGGFIGTSRDGFVWLDLDSGQIKPIHLPEADIPSNRFNDGKIDRLGRFWAGSMDENQKEENGSLYRLDTDLSISKMDGGYVIANGPAFSPDGTKMYHTDSAKKQVYVFDVDTSGAISHKKVFYQMSGDEGYPDGMTVSQDGDLWVCSFGGARVSRFSSAGRVREVIQMPVPNVTSCVFGGTRLDTLYITTARVSLRAEELRDHPLSGSLFSCKPGAQGMTVPLFNG